MSFYSDTKSTVRLKLLKTQVMKPNLLCHLNELPYCHCDHGNRQAGMDKLPVQVKHGNHVRTPRYATVSLGVMLVMPAR